MSKKWFYTGLAGILMLSGSHGFSAAIDKDLAEDPYKLAQQKEHQGVEGKPWQSMTTEELRTWARENMHNKVSGKLIDAAAHPEWEWFRKSGLGLFLHWGPAGVEPNNGEAWAMVWSKGKENAGREFILPEDMFAVAETWNPKRYDPDKWMAAASKAGFGYTVLTARHHDGYCLWPSEHGTWDTGDHMQGRDVVKDYVEACRKYNLRVGLYYSGPNWHYDYKNREFMNPPIDAFRLNYKHERIDASNDLIPLMATSSPEEKSESTAQVRELMTQYGDIDMMWWDGSVIMTPQELAQLQPNIFVARGMIATPEGKHHGVSEKVKISNECGYWWELCIKSENTFTPNWHYGVECETNHWDTNKLLTELVRCRSLGGNLLVNIPPRGNGEMMEWYYTLCDEMSEWMKHSSEATYDVDQDAPLPTLDKTENFTTKRGNIYYSLPDTNNLVLINDVTKPELVTLLRTGESMNFEFNDGTLRVVLPRRMETKLPDMVKIEF
ncbi:MULTISPECIES: alpha-L-fucosidase [unclassified Lentimonas]|uniref:alpha-L-fucosidase n=1 Tax=unclassified Lentimonas TaxID=2630993 RepID=UPI0013223967|nr:MULTISPECIES: alpha-L-fucosidase [unclassified Lentimonas]CAA6691727.1 Alpha-L-fucosidase (EC [Lentimonas sp. CC19]CAA6696081.1 Alpha-L-fucosidase (EC [Lentimonas sp. CC10]CAA7070078.1 Alpha-L-fucosidase (EC [Lentimonas sp. CC11]